MATRKPGPKAGAKAKAARAAAKAERDENGAPPVRGKAEPIFSRELNTPAVITTSKESGVIRGRAQYTSGLIQYILAYTTAGGEFKERWIDHDLLSDVPERRKPRGPKQVAQTPA